MTLCQLSESEIVNLIKSGLAYTDINLKHKISFETIKKICKKHNIEIARKLRGGHNFKDLTGQTFGALTVIDKSIHRVKPKLIYWNCNCLCGKSCIACGADLRQNKIKSCGCRTSIKNKRNWQGYGYISKSYWRVCNGNAEQRGFEFSVTIKYINNLLIKQNFKCKISGVDISIADNTASLDRIDSYKGYIKNNLQWIHKDLQSMKNNKSDTYFIDWCHKVSEYNKSKIID